MAAGNGEDTPVPDTLGRRSAEITDDGDDVSHLTDRDLILRAVNSAIATEKKSGEAIRFIAGVENRMGRRLDGIAEHLQGVDDRLVDIERRLSPGGEIEHRAQAASGHALDGAMKTFAERIVDAVHDEREGRGNITAERVMELIELSEARPIVRRAERNSDSKRRIVEAVVAGLVLALAAWAGGHFEGRATAPQTQVHP